MKKTLVLVMALAVISGPAFAGQTDRKDFQVMNDIIKQVNRYVWFTIFDDVSVGLDSGAVTLTGKVTLPFKRADIAKRVAKVDGVKGITNKIEVLPVSQLDDELRYRIARAIYGNPTFWSYAAMVNPPIHIVVDRGRVTLTGVVDSEVDKMLARSLASFSGAFSVKSDLKTSAEARASVEGA